MVERRILKEDSGAGPRYLLNTQLAADLIQFSQWQYDCLDYDPFHPMLVKLGKGLPTEEALWLSMLYMAFYNVGSTWVAFNNMDMLKPMPDWVAKLPVGVQRRNLYGGQVKRHVDDFSRLAKEHGGIENYLTDGMDSSHAFDANWITLKGNVRRAWGNGRWSVFTTSELYQKVNKLPVLPAEIGNDGSTGPRSGLGRLYNITKAEVKKVPVDVLDGLADQLFKYIRARITTKIPYLPNDHYDHGMLESQLCDFNSMCKGRYYVGRDIDRDQERIRKAENTLKMLGKRMSLREVWDARAAVFEKRYLGEFSGWLGRTEEAKTYYCKTGLVADHMTIREEARAGSLFKT